MLPGFTRAARFELLATLGAAGLYELAPDQLQLAVEEDATTQAAKRVLLSGDWIPVTLPDRTKVTLKPTIDDRGATVTVERTTEAGFYEFRVEGPRGGAGTGGRG